MFEKRKATRGELWPDTVAIIQYSDLASQSKDKMEEVKGPLCDLGSKGMYMHTNQHIPENRDLQVKIVFASQSNQSLSLPAEARAVRRDDKGVGFQFTAIDLDQLNQCITTMLSRTHAGF